MSLKNFIAVFIRRGPDLLGLVKDGRAKLMSTVLWLQVY